MIIVLAVGDYTLWSPGSFWNKGLETSLPMMTYVWSNSSAYNVITGIGNVQDEVTDKDKTESPCKVHHEQAQVRLFSSMSVEILNILTHPFQQLLAWIHFD